MSLAALIGSFLFPATDSAVYAQAALAALIFSAAAWFSRRNRDLLSFVGGLAALVVAAMALRTLH